MASPDQSLESGLARALIEVTSAADSAKPQRPRFSLAYDAALAGSEPVPTAMVQPRSRIQRRHT